MKKSFLIVLFSTLSLYAYDFPIDAYTCVNQTENFKLYAQRLEDASRNVDVAEDDLNHHCLPTDKGENCGANGLYPSLYHEAIQEYISLYREFNNQLDQMIESCQKQ